MAEDVKAAPKSRIDRAEVEKDISYIGARLREKSTYAGLAVLIGLIAPHFGEASQLATAIEYVGVGVGLLIAIFFPEKGSPVGRINSLGIGVIMLAVAVAITQALPVPASAAWPDVPQANTAVKVAAKPTTPAAAPAPLSLGDAIENLINEMQKRDAAIIKNIIAAIEAADADAGAVVTPATATAAAVVKDPIAHACYPAQIRYLQSLPTMKTTNIPAPYNLIVLFQYKRDFVNLLRSGQLVPVDLKLNCAALLGDEASIFAGTLGLLGIGATAINPITALGGSLAAAAGGALPLLKL